MKLNFNGNPHSSSLDHRTSRKAMNQYNYTPYQFGARSHACIRLLDIQSQQIFSVFTAFFRVIRGLIVASFVLFAILSLYAR